MPADRYYLAVLQSHQATSRQLLTTVLAVQKLYDFCDDFVETDGTAQTVGASGVKGRNCKKQGCVLTDSSPSPASLKS